MVHSLTSLLSLMNQSFSPQATRNAQGQMVLTDVPDSIRTSHNAWCQHAGCYEHPIHDRVIK